MKKIKNALMGIFYILFAAITWVLCTIIAIIFTLLPFALITATVVLVIKLINFWV